MTTKKKTTQKNKQIQKKFVRTDEIELHEGDVLIYRGSRSGKNWQFRMWIANDKRYLRKALGTKDKDQAKERATKLYLETHNKLDRNERVFDVPVKDLFVLYLKEQKKRIRVGVWRQLNVDQLS